MSKTSNKKSVLEVLQEENERFDELTRLREIQNRPKSYAEYLGGTLTEARETLGMANTAAALERDRSAPGYGTLGESLARRGLSRSGYADYLGDAADSAYRAARKSAEQGFARAKATREREYDAYLEKYDKKQISSLQTAIQRMARDGIESYDDGYRYAVAEGLSGENAELFARMCDAYGRRDFKNGGPDMRIAVLKEIMYNGLDYDSAYLYARAVGASSATAKRIAEYAASIKEEAGGILYENEGR